MVAITVMRVLLFLFHVFVLREYEGVGDAGVVLAVSAGCEFMSDTRGSGVESTANDVLEMSMLSGVRVVGGVCVCVWVVVVWVVLGGVGGWPGSGLLLCLCVL